MIRRIALLMCLALVGCGDQPVRVSDDVGEPVRAEPSTSSSGDEFYLDPQLLADFKEKALQGDASAARKVADHYAFSEVDVPGSIPWLRIAANQGDAIAMQNVATSLEALGGTANCREALEWFERVKRDAPSDFVLKFGIDDSIADLKEGMGGCEQK